MTHLSFWTSAIERAWSGSPLIFLGGVHAIGKTSVAKALSNCYYFDTTTPSDRAQLEKPAFWQQFLPGSRVIIDGLTHLEDPSKWLRNLPLRTNKHYLLVTTTLDPTFYCQNLPPHRLIVKTPQLWFQQDDQTDLEQRLLQGGAPSLAGFPPTRKHFDQWISQTYQRDLQVPLSARRHQGFMALLRQLFRQAGQAADVWHLAQACGLSRPTVTSHLAFLHQAFLFHSISPYRGGYSREQLKRSKIYAIDTGIAQLLADNPNLEQNHLTQMWQHLVLDHLTFHCRDSIHYWRNKDKREIDFVIRQGQLLTSIQCPLSIDHYASRSLETFRKFYPLGRNLVILPSLQEPFTRFFGLNGVDFIHTSHLQEYLGKAP